MVTVLLPQSTVMVSLFSSFALHHGFFAHASLGGIPELPVTCGSAVDLNGTSSGLIVFKLPQDLTEPCDIYLSVPVGHEMMFYFDWLDLFGQEYPDCDATNMELFDGPVNVRGLSRKVCAMQRQQMPTYMYFVENNFLVIHVNAPGDLHGTGFRIHYNLFRRAFPCMAGEFLCDTFGSRRCIADDLVCDDWNDCGDSLDELQNCTSTVNP